MDVPIKRLIVEYEVTGDQTALSDLVDQYIRARSEEWIEDVEKEIDQSPDSDSIYKAIDTRLTEKAEGDEESTAG